MALTPGARLGPYEILSALGVGGMGEVYRARDPKLHRDVAIKVLPESFAKDPTASPGFARRTLAPLNHPHIARFAGSGNGAGVVMELVEGDDRRGSRAIPLDEALPMAKQIAEVPKPRMRGDRPPRPQTRAGELTAPSVDRPGERWIRQPVAG